MSGSYPGSGLSIEQLVHALARALDPNSPSRKQLFESGLRKISNIERDLHEVLQTTKTIKNTLILVNKLPPDILSNVLEHRAGDRDLVAATHVCRCWRSTLISSPSLWTCFQFKTSHDVDRTLTYLERSKSAPIDIKVYIISPGDLEVFTYLAPHIARAKSLNIRGLHDTDVHAVCLLLRNPSPNLQHLEVCADRGLVCLPDDFLGRQAPSLRSASFSGVRPLFESHFPLPSLIEFDLFLPEVAGPFHVGVLLRFLSGCPWLRKIRIKSKAMSRDISLDQIISLESLVELDYACDPIGQILPYLRLPRLEKLRVSFPLGPGKAQNLSDLLPCGGHVLVAGTTEIKYYSYDDSQEIKLYGKGTDVSFSVSRPTADHTRADWFPNDACIPFGQIEDLTVGVSDDMGFPIDIAVFKNLRILRVIPWDSSFTEGFLGLLYLDPRVGIRCRSLEEIRYPCWGELEPLISLAKERKRVRRQLGLVRLMETWGGFDKGLMEELKEYVGEVLVEKLTEDM